MRRLFNKKAQSTLEYGILIAVVVGALIGMQTYVKRGLQGRVKEAADGIGTQFEPGTTNVAQEISHTDYRTTYNVSEGEVISTIEGKGQTLQETDTTPWSLP